MIVLARGSAAKRILIECINPEVFSALHRHGFTTGIIRCLRAMKMDLAKLIVDLSNPNKTRAASASADLASQIWAGSIDEATLIQWLESDDEPLRATTSWAVWDAGRPPHALKRLMELGTSDKNETVRLYCLRSWIDHHPKDALRSTTIENFCDDRCLTISRRASNAMETEGGHHS
jgi:hypothetical protein